MAASTEPDSVDRNRAFGYASVDADGLAWITETDMVEVDRVMTEVLGIELMQMMENAGRSLARLILDRYYPAQVTVVAGSGGNGGGGLVAARHMANAGVAVSIVTTRPSSALSPVTAHQFAVTQRMGLPVRDEVVSADVVVDAIIGYSLQGEPQGRSADLINEILNLGRLGDSNGQRPAVVALDTPSGLDVTTGMTPGVAVVADATLTLCLPKIGMRSSSNVGDLYLADISVPPSVTAPLGLRAGVGPPCFGPGSILAVSGR